MKWQKKSSWKNKKNKMHLYFLTRGIKKNVDNFINDMSAQYFPTGLPGNMWVQLSMRPIQLWECVMPEANLHDVLATLKPNDEQEHRKIIEKFRFLLGAKKVPELNPKANPRMVFKNDVAIYPIGIKEDAKVYEQL